MMIQTSVIIPSREERWLDKTINEVKTKFGGTYEIICVLDGKQKIKRFPKNVHYVKNDYPRGMRTAINQAVKYAKGRYLMKLDAHCMLGKDIDLKLIKEHKSNWVQIPRRKRLNPHSWVLMEGRPIDYMKIGEDFIGRVVHKSSKKPIDNTETFQGSCYFIERKYFNRLNLLDDINFAGSGNEAQEITLKILHDGGRVIRNKKTWYAHARTNRYYSTDRSKSREYIMILAKQYGYRQH